MNDTSDRDASPTAKIEAQFSRAGWLPNEVLREPSVRTPLGTYRPSLALTYSLYPFATLEIFRPEALPNDGAGWASTDLGGQPFPIQLESDGTSTWQRGAKEGAHWTPVPSPQDLWALLGRNWVLKDPRLIPRISEMPAPVHHVCAVGMALDALDAGRRRIQIVMPQGTGKTRIAKELIWKLLASGQKRRVLCLTTRRAIAEGILHEMADVAAHYDVALLPNPRAVDDAPVHIATTAYFLLPSRLRLDRLSPDTYDLIVLADLLDQQKNLRDVTQHFPDAHVIGFSARPYVEPSFGDPAFQLTIGDALATETIAPPNGFRAVRLGDIANISMGMTLTTDALVRGSSLITARSLPTDGNWPATERRQADLSDSDVAMGSDGQHAVQPSDILISAIINPMAPRIAMVPSSSHGRLYVHSSVYVIRVTDTAVVPEDVFAFLRSDSGMRSLQRGASFLGGSLRITARDLAQLQIFIPEQLQISIPETIVPTPPPGAISAAPQSSTLEQSLSLRAPETSPTPDEIRRATPGVAEVLSGALSAAGQAIRDLKGIVLPDLEALERDPQNRDSMFVSARLREIAATLAPPPLAERVMLRYPMPIALAYRRFLDSRFNVYEQVLRLRDLFEAAAFFVYNALLADALRRLHRDRYVLSDRNARVAYDGFSMAHRISFVEGIAAIAKEHDPTELFMPELCDSSFCTHARRLQSDFRNHISHSATASESRQRAILNRYQPVVESMLEGLAFLEDYRLARIASLYMRDGKCVRRVELYQGVTPAIDEQAFEPNQQPELAEHDHLVLLDENDDHLDLFPMYQFMANEQTGDDTHVCCLKQRRGKELLGESVQAPIDVTLEGAVLFETLRSHFHDKS